MVLDRVLVNGHRVAPLGNLVCDERAVRLARAAAPDRVGGHFCGAGTLWVGGHFQSAQRRGCGGAAAPDLLSAPIYRRGDTVKSPTALARGRLGWSQEEEAHRADMAPRQWRRVEGARRDGTDAHHHCSGARGGDRRSLQALTDGSHAGGRSRLERLRIVLRLGNGTERTP